MGGLRDPLFLSRYGHILRGVRRVVTVANPGAGNDWSIVVPGGKQWRVNALRALFTSSAAVGNRFPRLLFTDGNVTFFETTNTATAITAGLAMRIAGAIDAVPGMNTGAGSISSIFLPDIWLGPEFALIANTTNLDVADAWASIQIYVEEVFFDSTLLNQRYFAMLDAMQTDDVTPADELAHLLVRLPR